MTDNEIVKALECCGRNSIAGRLNDCKNCPLNDRTACISEVIYKSLDLINRQKAEIERMDAERQMADGYADALVEITKSKAYREFAERLKEKSSALARLWIDNELKELVGEDG